MAFKMTPSSKELDGAYNFSNKHCDSIKAGSAGLGMAGQIPDGPGSQGEAGVGMMNVPGPSYKMDSGGVGHFNDGLRKASEDGKLSKEFGAVVDADTKKGSSQMMNKDY